MQVLATNATLHTTGILGQATNVFAMFLDYVVFKFLLYIPKEFRVGHNRNMMVYPCRDIVRILLGAGAGTHQRSKTFF